MSEETYNGWKNKETWLVNVHEIAHPRGDLEEAALRAYEPEGSRRAAVFAVEDELRAELDQAQDYAAELLGRGHAGHEGALFFLDIIATALSRVDTQTLAEHIVDDIPGIPTTADAADDRAAAATREEAAK